MDIKNQTVLYLLKCSVIGHSPVTGNRPIFKTNWNEILKIAIEQGVAPILVTFLEKLPQSQLPPKNVLLKWYGFKVNREKSYEYQWEQSCKFANRLTKRGAAKCIVLKGFSIASYYPYPKTRIFGDLDCYLISYNASDKEPKFEVGNEVALDMGYAVEQAGYKHTHILCNNLLIENHQYLTNFNETKQGIKIEKVLRQLALEGKERRLWGSNLWKPSAEFNIIFLLKHSLGDFIANDMTLKSLYDWAVLMKAEQGNIDWKRMDGLLEECRLKNFFCLMTEACMDYLGLEVDWENFSLKSQHKMVDSMLHDILTKPKIGCGQLTFLQKIPNILRRFYRQYKYRRIETEGTFTLMCNTLLYSSYLRRRVKLE